MIACGVTDSITLLYLVVEAYSWIYIETLAKGQRIGAIYTPDENIRDEACTVVVTHSLFPVS